MHVSEGSRKSLAYLSVSTAYYCGLRLSAEAG